MPSYKVHIKHAGKVYDLPLNTDASAKTFKESVYQVTGVPLERMKIMIKGGMLKVCIRASGMLNSSTYWSARMIQIGKRWHRRRLDIILTS